MGHSQLKSQLVAVLKLVPFARKARGMISAGCAVSQHAPPAASPATHGDTTTELAPSWLRRPH